ncbi:DUF3710 domain-containing protein [Aeromicrobium sp. CF4.19]|uniref:DUF3710 domain-containing protein n=1 Tax=Aeromicrobium sp. CF4.19 TaxID=3373082 RepID=UPI003EE4E7D9
MRRRKQQEQAEQAQENADEQVVDGPRSNGPWDRAEKEPSERHLDLGALLVRGRIGTDLRVPTEADGNRAAVVLLTEDAGLEMRAFAAPRSGGLWDEVRVEMGREVERLEGSCEEVAGPFGTELHVRLPATTPEGEPGVQPTRVIAVEGPRWMLRGTFLGRAALEPTDEGILMESFRDTIVVRGVEPRMAREALPVAPPVSAPTDGTAADDTSAT